MWWAIGGYCLWLRMIVLGLSNAYLNLIPISNIKYHQHPFDHKKVNLVECYTYLAPACHYNIHFYNSLQSNEFEAVRKTRNELFFFFPFLFNFVCVSSIIRIENWRHSNEGIFKEEDICHSLLSNEVRYHKYHRYWNLATQHGFDPTVI